VQCFERCTLVLSMERSVQCPSPKSRINRTAAAHYGRNHSRFLAEGRAVVMDPFCGAGALFAAYQKVRHVQA
jgi:hypothetical protein